MQEFVYRTPIILDVADLKRCLIAAWSDLLQHVIDKAACVKADVKYFKHLL